MASENETNSISLDGIEYNLDDLSDAAKQQLRNIQFVDERILQLNNEWAVADTARIGYTNALRANLKVTGDQ